MFLLVLVFFGLAFYVLLKKVKAKNSCNNSSSAPFEEIEVVESEEERLHREISEWSSKQRNITLNAAKEFHDVKPTSDLEDNTHILAVCEDCFAIFAIEPSELKCPCCKSSRLNMGNRNKIYSGSWSESVNGWAYCKDSAHPHRYTNTKSI